MNLMERGIIKTNNRYFRVLIGIAVMLLFICLYPPEILRSASTEKLKIVLRLLSAGISGFLFLIKAYKEERISKLWIIYLVYAVWANIVTLIHKADIVAAGYQYTILALGIIMFCDVFMNVLKEDFYKYIYIALYILILVNLVTWIYDYQPEPLFGNTNAWFNFYILAVIVGFRYNFKTDKLYKKLLFIVLSLIMLLTSYLNRSITTLFTLTAIYLYIIFFNNEKIKKLFSLPVYVVFNILFFVVIVLNGRNAAIAKVLSDFFHKGAGFSGRSPIWSVGLEQISNSFLIGHGVKTIEDMIEIIKMGETLSIFHNMYIQQMFMFGLIGFILFCLVFAAVIKSILSIKEYKLQGFAKIIIFGMLLRGQMETGMQLMLVFVLSMLYYLDSPQSDDKYISIRGLLKWKK